MFKLALALCVVAAIATPVIELELDQAGLRSRSSNTRFVSEKQANTAKVHECQAKTSTAPRNCALPKASAYDHHEGDLTGKIQRVITLVSTDAGVCKKNCQRNNINYNKRSEYVVKYDVKDKSGNAADQVVFAVVLSDYQAPKFNFAGLSYTRECKKATATVPKPTALDNIDGSVAVKINGRSSATQSLKHTKKSTTYSFWTSDKAGMFGNNGRNNVATARKTFTVRDTTKPVLKDAADFSVECKKGLTKTIAHTKCYDACDDTKNVQGKYQGKHQFAATKTMKFDITYTCTDKAGLSATATKTRVTIKDTTKPTIKVDMAYQTYKSRGTWNGKIYTHHGGKSGQGFQSNQHNSFSCSDSCCKDVKETHGWVKSCSDSTKASWNELKPGTYYHKFTCTDCNGHSTSACRTVVNEDKWVPIITILGSGKKVLEATHDKNYIDDGATCSDHVDGVISKNVQVSGDVVNMKKTGTYKIHYDCKDAAGNKAPRVTRTVVVQDTTCPTCAVTGAKQVTREASFTYSDAGAKCTDSLDGSLKVNVKGSVNTETTGTYKLTYSATDKSGNSNTGAKSCKSRQGAVVRTVTVKDTLKPVIALHFGGKKIHESAANDKGSNGQRNPAQDKFMAETSSVNGWIVGAIASAVAGVALLALGSKQTVTSVPV